MQSLTTPLRFERHALEKVWGGRALETTFGFELPPGQPIGETWEVVDREGENSVVAAAPGDPTLVGTTLRALMERSSGDLLGGAPANRLGRFPVLVKYIDASQDLSVQVHPDEESAVAIGGGAETKPEAWYVVDVAPGGKLYAGLRSGVTAEEYARVADSPQGVELLRSWDVRAGDCVLVPGGTVHAIGAGVTILEVQQNSDTTYRLYDWGRVGLDGRPRETHVPEGLAATRFGVEFAGPVRLDPGGENGWFRGDLARSAFFRMELLVAGGGVEAEEARISTAGAWQVLAVVAGHGILSAPDGAEAALEPGDVWLVPAAAGHVQVRRRSGADELRLVRATA